MEDQTEFREIQRKRNQLLIKDKNDELDDSEIIEFEKILTAYAKKKNENDKINHETIIRIREILSEYSRYGSLHLGGVPMIADDMITFIKNDLIYN